MKSFSTLDFPDDVRKLVFINDASVTYIILDPETEHFFVLRGTLDKGCPPFNNPSLHGLQLISGQKVYKVPKEYHDEILESESIKEALIKIETLGYMLREGPLPEDFDEYE